MIFKPYKNDLWFSFRQRKRGDVDKEAIVFGRIGEFGLLADLAFERHINRLITLNNKPYIQSLNGQRIKAIRELEPFWL